MLIAIEGIDGSGKGTQTKLLADRLREAGIVVDVISFPQYQRTFFGKEVGKYLHGDFGTLESIHPKFSALLYALDRFELRERINSSLKDDAVVICDRYIGSNVAHQCARVPAQDVDMMAAWIEHVETSVLKLVPASLTILLDTDVGTAQDLVGRKEKRSYTDKSHDLHESSSNHLSDALQIFRSLAQSHAWATVRCCDESGEMREAEAISDEIYALVNNARSRTHLRNQIKTFPEH